MIEKVVLASASPRRKEILEMLGIPFEVVVSDAEENAPEDMSVGEYTKFLAREKCRNAAEKLTSRGEDISRTLIIGCDTVVCYDGMVIGKPPDDIHATLTLGVLSDSWHSVYSGLALCLDGILVNDFARTDVKFRELSEREIMKYVASGEPRGKAGSYAIQLRGASFAERIEGDFYNIVGFPVALFTRMLKEHFGTEICDISEK